MLKKFAVIGGGAWGTALACLVTRAVADVTLYAIEEQVINEINNQQKNTHYLGDIALPMGIKATSNMQDIIAADLIILAAPSHVFVTILQELKAHGLSKDTILLIATKGLSSNPLLLFSEKIENELENSYAFISGPNFAKEVAEDKFSAITISSKNIDIANKIALILASNKLDVTVSDDIVTIQIAGIIKNIAAIKSGIMQSDGAGENAKAWLISGALGEIAMIAKTLGGKAESLSLPAVIGDLVLTCYSVTSRNTKFGYKFHQNNYCKQFLADYPILVEGVSSARLLKNFLAINQIKLDLPIIRSIFDII